MAAWDVTAFGNDDAAEWAMELVDAPDPSAFLEATLGLAEEVDYLEAPDGAQLVAAAAVIAAACANRPKGLPPELAAWLPGKAASLTQLAPAALAALELVRSDESELQELWRDSDDFPAWCADLDAISTTLSDSLEAA